MDHTSDMYCAIHKLVFFILMEVITANTLRPYGHVKIIFEHNIFHRCVRKLCLSPASIKIITVKTHV